MNDIDRIEELINKKSLTKLEQKQLDIHLDRVSKSFDKEELENEKQVGKS